MKYLLILLFSICYTLSVAQPLCVNKWFVSNNYTIESRYVFETTKSNLIKVVKGVMLRKSLLDSIVDDFT